MPAMDANINPHEVELREQDRWLPIANVARLMKNTLPPTAKVSKDAKECMQECVSEFISFITSEASDKCLREKRKTINGEDILYLMHDLGFENYAEVLKIYLAKYREQQAMKQERGETRATKRQSKAAEDAQLSPTSQSSDPDTPAQRARETDAAAADAAADADAAAAAAYIQDDNAGKDEYPYEEFMGANDQGGPGEHSGGIGLEQLSNGEDIDTLTAGITRTSGEYY